MKWNIVADSSSDLKSDFFSGDSIGFHIVPLKILVGNHEYVDDDTIDVRAMLQDMKQEKEASKSACPSPDDFAKAFEAGENTVCFTISGQLSGTYNCACVARDMVKEKYPEKNIFVLDTKSTAGELILLSEKAKALIEKDTSYDALCNQLTEYSQELLTTFSLSNFDNLIKTGRMNSFAGALASTLGIRAVAIATPEGKIDVVKKPRGEDRAIGEMVKMISLKKGIAQLPIIICHCMNLEGAQKVKEQLKKVIGASNVRIFECKGLTGFYAMNGGIIISY